MQNDAFNVPIEYYPIVIRQSRYTGVYEGGKFYCYSEAFFLPNSYLNYLDGDDDAALDFWQSDDSKYFGIGNTPDDAFLNFFEKQKNLTNQEEYNEILSAFKNKLITDKHPELVERTDYYRNSYPIFLPRKNKEF